MTRLRTWLLACLLSIASAGCGATHEREVMVIEKTGMYHREDCAPVHMAKTEAMPLSEAKARHFKPCPVCTPDRE